jgi:hypothetical protein
LVSTRDIGPTTRLGIKRPEFRERWQDNLLHRHRQYPFYALDPALVESPVAQWWSQRFRQILDCCGPERLSQKIAVVEWFPYHTQKLAHAMSYFSSIPPLMSQQYSLQLAAKSLLDRRKVVIALWGSRVWSLWSRSLFSIGSGLENAIKLRNHQSAYLTHGNMEPDDYRRVMNILEK